MMRRATSSAATAPIRRRPWRSLARRSRPPASPRSRMSEQLDTYGGAAALTFKVTDSLTITPRIMQQRADYNGFPMADYLSDAGQWLRLSRPVAGPRPAAEAAVSEQLHASARVQRSGRRLRCLGIVLRSPSTGRPVSANSSPRPPISPARWMRPRMRATSCTRGSPRAPAAHRSRAASSEDQGLPALRRGSALCLRSARADPIRRRRLLLGFPRPPAVRRLLSAGDRCRGSMRR